MTAAAQPPRRSDRPAQLFTFAGPDRAAAVRDVRRLAALLAATADRPGQLRELAATMAGWAAEPGRTWVAVVAGDTGELAGLLARAEAGDHDPAAGLYQADPAAAPGLVAFVFPGQGSQRPGMLAELFDAFPRLHGYLRIGRRWAPLMLPPPGDEAAGRAQATRLTDTRVAQPALGLAGMAAFDLLTSLGVVPDMLAGHSYGELVALCAAGVLGTAALLELSVARAEAILAAAPTADPGAMAAVAAGATTVAGVLTTVGLSGRVVLANHNSPRQTVISGPTPDVAAAVAALRAAGRDATRLRVACAFHSPLVAAASERFAAVLAGYRFAEAGLPVWSNRTALPYPTDTAGIARELAAQIAAPVRFADQIEAMYSAGARIFVEAGPGRVVTRLVGDVLGDRPHLAAGLEERPGDGWRGLVTLLARLAVAGVPVRTRALHDALRDAAREGPTDFPPKRREGTA